MVTGLVSSHQTKGQHLRCRCVTLNQTVISPIVSIRQFVWSHVGEERIDGRCIFMCELKLERASSQTVHAVSAVDPTRIFHHNVCRISESERTHLNSFE